MTGGERLGYTNPCAPEKGAARGSPECLLRVLRSERHLNNWRVRETEERVPKRLPSRAAEADELSR